MNATTTTKYELTDAQLDDMVSRVARAWNSESIRQAAREWFASLPVVSREAAERALGDATREEFDQFDSDYMDHDGDGPESFRYALGHILADRRAMLGGGPVGGPPKSEGESADATSEDMVPRGVLKLMTIPVTSEEAMLAYNAYRNRPGGGSVKQRLRHAINQFICRRYDLADVAPVEPASPDPAPAPQPAIDVAAELAKVREDVKTTLLGHRADIDNAHRRIAAVENAQDTHRDTMHAYSRRAELQSERLDDLRDRIAALESTARRSGTRTGRSW